MGWTTIPDSALQPGAPVRSLDGLSLRDNPIAIAQGLSGAPKVETDALDIDAVLEATARDYTFGALGTHCLAFHSSSDIQIVAGTTYSGSNLRPAGLSSGGGGLTASALTYASGSTLFAGAGTNVSTLSGTWMALGTSVATGTGFAEFPTTLYVRVL